MKAKTIATFDLEVRSDPAKVGWTNFDVMGISAFGIHVNSVGTISMHDEDTLRDALDVLLKVDVLVSFNGIYFDLPLIAGTARRLDFNIMPFMDIWFKPHYDILAQVKHAAKQLRGKGLHTMDAIASSTLGRSKEGAASESIPMLFSDGRVNEICAACRNHVRLTADLFDFINTHGYVLNGAGEQINLPTLEDFDP